MRTYAAELYIYYTSTEVKIKRLEDFFNSFKNDLNVNKTKNSLKVENDGTIENWFVNKSLSDCVCMVICCDVHNSKYNYNVCLENQEKRINNWLKDKLIDCSVFRVGIPNEKKWLFFPKFKKVKLLGAECFVFLYLSQFKYIYNNSFKQENLVVFKRLIQEKWNLLQSEEKLISLNYREYNHFLEKIDTTFSRELNGLMKR